MLLAVTRHRHISPLGRNIRRYRHAQGWSQQELADRSGVSRVTIARLESGAATSASIEIAERLADALGISLAELTADPELAAGAAKLADMVDLFVASGLAEQLPGGPATSEELDWVRRLPVVYWGGQPPTPMSIYHLILARRAAGLNS